MSLGSKVYFIQNEPKLKLCGLLIWAEDTRLLIAIPAQLGSGTSFSVPSEEAGSEPGSAEQIEVSLTWVAKSGCLSPPIDKQKEFQGFDKKPLILLKKKND